MANEIWLFIAFLAMIGIIILYFLNKITTQKESLNKPDENYQTGKEFEEYTLSLFSEKLFAINNWTRDNSKTLGRRVETDSDPDFTFRHKRTDQLISVECKYRSFYTDGKVKFAEQWKIDHYINYAKENNRPTFLILGLGGEPDNPDRLFCVPIEKAKYPELYLSMLEKYECELGENFKWINNDLF